METGLADAEAAVCDSVNVAFATMLDTPLVTFTFRSIALANDNFGQTILKKVKLLESIKKNRFLRGFSEIFAINCTAIALHYLIELKKRFRSKVR